MWNERARLCLSVNTGAFGYEAERLTFSVA